MTASLAVTLLALVLMAGAPGTASASVNNRAPVLASALSAVPATPQAITRGFDIWNLTGTPATLATVRGQACGSLFNEPYCKGADAGDAPPVGSVLGPGQAQHFEVIHYVATDTIMRVNYSTGASFVLEVDAGDTPSIPDSYSKFTGLKICPTSIVCDVSGSSLTFLDPPGTIHNIGPGQGQEQAQVLKQLCLHNAKATCDFKVTHEDRLLAKNGLKILKPIIPNGTKDDVTVTVACTNTYTLTDSIGGSLTTDIEVNAIAAMIKSSISLKYHHDITASAEFSFKLTYSIRPGDEGWVQTGDDIFRDYGDFTITMGHTTWHVTDVYFDSADPNGNVIWQPMTQSLKGGPITPVPFTSLSKTGVGVGGAINPPIPDQCQQV